MIEKVNNYKFLGVFIDDKLDWKEQYNYISKKLTGIIRKVRPVANKYTLLYIYIYIYIMLYLFLTYTTAPIYG